MTKDDALDLAIEVIESAIASGDWTVDGACDPDLAMVLIKQARNTRLSLPDELSKGDDSPGYVEGWNDCREVMKGIMK